MSKMKTKIVLTNDKERADMIIEGLRRRGGYCPCMVAKNEDTKCRCKEFREMPAPCTCLCGLFHKIIIEEDDDISG